MPFIFLAAIILGFASLMAIGRYFGERKRDIIKRAVEANGGIVKGFRLTGTGTLSVTFVSCEGDLRQAFANVRGGKVTSFEEQPYQRYLASKIFRSPGRRQSDVTINLDDLRWQGELMELPGYQAYKQTILLLAARGQPNIEIHESVLRTDGFERGFAPILQCVLMQARDIPEPDSGVLDLNVNGQPILMGWRVDGVAPNRTLILSLAPMASKD
jgi:hypothetical protein